MSKSGYSLRTTAQRKQTSHFINASPYHIPRRGAKHSNGSQALNHSIRLQPQVPVVPQPLGFGQPVPQPPGTPRTEQIMATNTEKMLSEILTKTGNVQADLQNLKSQVENHTEQFDIMAASQGLNISQESDSDPIFLREERPNPPPPPIQDQAGEWESVRDQRPTQHFYHNPVGTFQPRGAPRQPHPQVRPHLGHQQYTVPPPRGGGQTYPYPSRGDYVRHQAPRGGRGHFRGGHRGRSFSDNVDPRPEYQEHDQYQQRGGRRSSLTYDMRSEIRFLIKQQTRSDRVHEEVIDHEIIIDGLPYVDGDPWETEVARAVGQLVKIEKTLSHEDIEDIHRFRTPTGDGARPMRVTLFSKLQALHLSERARRAGITWFRSSKSKHFRNHNAMVPQRIKEKNARLPDNSLTVWGERQVGRVWIHKRVPNPNYIPMGAGPSGSQQKTVQLPGSIPPPPQTPPQEDSTMGES